MGKCDICGEKVVPAYTCTHCDATLCGDHRLPEKHNCPAARSHESDGPVFESDAPSTLGHTSDLTERRSDEDSETAVESDPRDGMTADEKSSNRPTGRGSAGDGAPDVVDPGSELPTAAKDPPTSSSPDVTKTGGVDWSEASGRGTTDDNDDEQLFLREIRYELTQPSTWVLSILAVCGTVFVISATMGTGVAPIDSTVDDIVSGDSSGGDESSGAPTPAETQTPESESSADAVVAQPDQTPTPDTNGGGGGGLFGGFDQQINQTRVERAAHERVNEIRAAHGLSEVHWDDRLQTIADGHSTDMAENDYFSHSSPAGENFEDRYDEAGYDCRVQISDVMYSNGGENIAKTYADGDIDTDERGVINYHNNETRIGRGVVNAWMDSPGHRENILKNYWQREGIGIAVSGNEVYATQNFC